jgi:hypothetical protein
MSIKKTDWVILSILAIIVLCLHVYVALSPAESLITWYTTDDAYYYFKVAQNVVAGHGFTFDQINLTNGFHPLWMFVCIAVFGLFRQDPITPLRALIVVMALLNIGTGFILYFLLRRKLSTLVSGLGAFFWVLFPYIHFITSMHGLESGINAFFLVLFTLVAADYRESSSKQRKPWPSLILIGVIASLAFLSRLDNVFTIVVVGFWVILRGLKINHIVIVDIGLSFFSVAASYIARFGFSLNYHPFLNAAYMMVGLCIVINPLILWLFGLYKTDQRHTAFTNIAKLLFSLLASTFIVSAGMLVFSRLKLFDTFPRSTLIYNIIFTFLLLGGLRLIIWLRKPVANPEKETNSFIQWLQSRWKAILCEGFIFSLPILFCLLGYFAWNHYMFGTFMPISGQIKHWWATLPNTVYSHNVDPFVLLGFSPSLNYGPWGLLTIPANYLTSLIQHFRLFNGERSMNILFLFFLFAEFALIWLVYRSNRKAFTKIASGIGVLPLFVSSLIQISYYNATGYPNARFWYWINEVFCITILVFVLFQLAMDWLKTKKIKSITLNVIIGILAIGLILANATDIISHSSYNIPADHKSWYLKDAQGMESLVPQGSKIGMTGGGTVAYFTKDRTIINLDGLMNSVEYFRSLKAGTADAFLERIGMKYIFANEYVITSSDPYMTQFNGHLIKIGLIRGAENFTLFEFNMGN